VRSSATPIEAEGELVQVVVEVCVADRPLVGSQQPALEQGGYAVNSRHELVGQSMAALDVCDIGTSAPSLKLGRTQKIEPLHLVMQRLFLETLSLEATVVQLLAVLVPAQAPNPEAGNARTQQEQRRRLRYIRGRRREAG
jgi:hypothetical protein